MARNDMIEIEDLVFLHETDEAIIVEGDGKEGSLPKSQIEWPEDSTRGDVISVEMPEWLALDRGLI